MKKHFTSGLLIFTFLFSGISLKALPTTIPSQELPVGQLDKEVVINSSNKELSEILGVDHTLKQRVVFNRIKRNLKKHPEMSIDEASASSPGKGFAIAGLVTGILCTVFCWIPILAQVLAILGIVFSGIALWKMKKNGSRDGKGMAIAGLATGIIGGVIGLGFLFILLALSL